MKKWQLWKEGYACTGQRASASFLGEFEAPTFKEACDIWGNKPENKPFYKSKDVPSHWACRIFDNEAQARRSFG